jgi:alkylation response protein AidB-like acyl-CoA dehydrogenase
MASSSLQATEQGAPGTSRLQTEQDVILAVDRIRPVVERYIDESEQQRHLSRQAFDAMQTEGLMNLWAPREYGGFEVSIPTFTRAVEEVAYLDGAAGWTMCIMSAGNLLTSYLEPTAARELYAGGLDQPMPGSVVPRGRLTEVDGGYQLSGRWPLGSGSQYGDWICASGFIFDGEAPRMGPHGPELLNTFVNRKDVELLDTWHSVGLRGTGSTDFVVKDAFVPANRVFPVFTAQPQVSGPLYAAGPLALFGMAVVAVFPGIARAAIDSFVELAKGKTPTLSQTGLADRPTIHAEVARAKALVQSSRAYFYQVGREMMESLEAGKGITDEIEAERRLACVNLAESCRAAVDSMFNLAGSTVVYSGHKIERCMRDVRTASQHLLASPVWWEKTGQFYFGQGLGMP